MLDFDYLIITNQYFSTDSLRSTVQFFVERGIRKFIFTLDFNRELRTVTWIMDRLKRLDELLKSFRPRSVSFYVCANLTLTEGVLYDPQLRRLCIDRSNLLFIQLPFFVDEAWIRSNLNHLLFERKISPIFTSFENNLQTNPSSLLESCLRSSFYRFAIDVNYLTALDSKPFVARVIDERIPILPCVSHSLPNYVGVDSAFAQLRQSLGEAQYFQLCRTIQQGGHKLFSVL